MGLPWPSQTVWEQVGCEEAWQGVEALGEESGLYALRPTLTQLGVQEQLR
ncbi:MAG: hypothetical protein V3U27_06535 [Candidatus Tectomicrobia bacterium]